MRPIPRRFAEAVEKFEGLDPLSEPMQKIVNDLVPQDSKLKELLSGSFWGHPIHPVLTDVVIGTWTSAFLLDLLGGKKARPASRRLVGLGILSAMPTAAAGLSDWAELWGKQRRIGTIHAVANTTALTLYGWSWLRRRRGRGRLIGIMAYGVATTSAYLGGHLSFGKGVGVNQTAFEEWPGDWTAVLPEKDLPAGELTKGEAGNVAVMLYRQGDRVFALSNRCTHRGCPLHEGRVNPEDRSITCMCHSSTFRLDDGEVLSGPATDPAPSFEARINNGNVEVRLPQE